MIQLGKTQCLNVIKKTDFGVYLGTEDDKVLVKVKVNQDDLGRVIGKKGRVASAIRTLAHAVAIRQKQNVDIEFSADEESSN